MTRREYKLQTITIHVDAPAKPALGALCNGCGVCCAAEPCPVSLALLWPHQKPCKALMWQAAEQRYYCGLVSQPEQFLWWLPKGLHGWTGRVMMRWISAGTQCDADAEVVPDE